MDTDSGTDTDMSKNNSRDQAKHHDRHRTLHSLRKGHYDLSVDTVIDLDSNVTIFFEFFYCCQNSRSTQKKLSH